MSPRLLTHLGICVSDLERSTRFYRDVLGCVEVGRLELEGQATAQLNGWKEAHVRAVYLERDGWRLELMEFPVPGWMGPREARPMNQVGLTHLSFRVEGLDALCARIEEAGGALLRDTRMRFPGGGVIMACDPDGVRLELIQRPGPLDAVPGSPEFGLRSDLEPEGD